MTNIDLLLVAALLVWWTLVVGFRLWIWRRETRDHKLHDRWIQDSP